MSFQPTPYTTQADLVLDYMQRNGSISSTEAFLRLGVTRLSAAIFVLKKRGQQIKTTRRKALNRFGKPVSFAVYSLADNAD